MLIAFITGSYPPDTCGIGDYTFNLTEALRREGVDTEVFCRYKWQVRNSINILSALKSKKPDLIHIQYPTVGFGWHLTPQILSLSVPCIVTIHEVTKAHLLRKLALYPFSLRSRHIIFTTDYERNYATRCAPWIALRSSTIPIGSNIIQGALNQQRSLNEIIYFGMFRRNRGLEEVFTLASIIKKRTLPFQIRLIGKPHPGDLPYFHEMYYQSQQLPIKWSIGLEEQAIADILSQSSLAYMPFPDGASGRRGSLFALLRNGVTTITSRGSQTPTSLEKSVLFAEKPDEAIELIHEIVRNDGLRKRISENAVRYASQFSWENIARRHIELYQKITG